MIISFAQLFYFLGRTTERQKLILKFKKEENVSTITQNTLEEELVEHVSPSSDEEIENQVLAGESDEPSKESQKSNPIKIEYYEPAKIIKSNNSLPYCYEIMDLKGDSIKIPKQAATGSLGLTWEKVEEFYSERKIRLSDGCYIPEDCIPDQYLTIIVPYRNREEHLLYFVYYLHQFLQNQKRAYCIIIVEQSDFGQFNRAKLMNIGYLEAKKHRFWKKHNINTNFLCYSFHDVDLIPDDDNNLYLCHPEKAIHQCDKYNKYNYQTQFTAGRHVSAGGAALIPGLQYEMINGHPNWYWGWGVEDIDMSIRLRNSPVNVSESSSMSPNPRIAAPLGATQNIYFKEGLTEDGGGPGLLRQDFHGKYTQMSHTHGFTNGPLKSKIYNELSTTLVRFQIGAFRNERVKWDGLNQTIYKVNKIDYNKFYTKINVEIRPAITKHMKLSVQNKVVLNLLQEGDDTDTGSSSKSNDHDPKTCKFIKLKNVIAKSKLLNPEEYPNHMKPFKEKLKTALTKCFDMNKNHGQCNMFSMVDFWIPKSLPYPLVSKQAGKINENVPYDSFVRHCPNVIGWFQVVEGDVVLDITSTNSDNRISENKTEPVPGPLDYKIQTELEILELPIKGGLFYNDFLVFEGSRHSGRWIDIGELPEIGSKKVVKSSSMTSTDNSSSTTIEIRYPEKHKLVIAIAIKFENFVPGVGLFNHKFLDYFGQPYFDANIVFKVIGNTNNEYDDENLREKYLEGLRRKDSDEFSSENITSVRREIKGKIIGGLVWVMFQPHTIIKLYKEKL